MPVEGLYVTSEYARTSYFRPGFKMTNKNANTADNYNNPFDVANIYDGNLTSSKGWRPIPEKAYRDKGFFVFFDYNKGPISIFPIGYAWLGQHFVSNYFGLPGFDMSSMLGGGLLPIKIQSLDLFIAWPKYTKKNYKYELLYIKGGEHKPMYLDPSGMASMPEMASTAPLFDRLNNRNTDDLLINLAYWSNKFSYYLTDKITLSTEFNSIKAAIGPGCIDANDRLEIKDEFGTLIGKSMGNGHANCLGPAAENQDFILTLRFKQVDEKYSIFWRTSKKSELSVGFGRSMQTLVLDSSDPTVSSIIRDAVTFGGESYYLNNSFSYRLTDVSTISMWYNNKYYRAADPLGIAMIPASNSQTLDIDNETNLWLQDHQDTSSIGFSLNFSF